MDEKQEIIENIIKIEWEMFTAVNEGGPRASCQEDFFIFSGMRNAQFSAWSLKVVASYLKDLKNAQKNGRNLLEAKYIHMMKTTEPLQYGALIARVEIPAESAIALAKELSAILLKQTQVLFEEYPYVSGYSRPLSSAQDYSYTSVETYQLGELLTYSTETLIALNDHVTSLETEGISLARIILENTVRFYGYETLDIAETAVKAQLEGQDSQVSFGCDSCEGNDL